MPNYFQDNLPNVVSITIPAATMETMLGVQVARTAEVGIRLNQLDVTYGQDAAGQGWTVDWAEYTIPGTAFKKRVGRYMPGDRGNSNAPFFRDPVNPDPTTPTLKVTRG